MNDFHFLPSIPGLSGCRIELVSPSIIRKVSANKEYNARLLLQIKKQQTFKELNFNKILTPTILSYNTEDLFYFDMQYIPAANFNSFFKFCSPKKINFFIECLEEYLDRVFLDTKLYVKTELIEQKLISLYDLSNHKNFISKLMYLVNTQNLRIPLSYCHGDLTLSNILFSENNVYFIDFLDSYIDSAYIDLAKLKQDLVHRWNLGINHIQDPRIRINYNYIWRHIEVRYSEFLSNPIFDIIESVNLLRIESYVKHTEKEVILNSILKGLKLYE
jgi:thiamine kinase-like enzyme